MNNQYIGNFPAIVIVILFSLLSIGSFAETTVQIPAEQKIPTEQKSEHWTNQVEAKNTEADTKSVKPAEGDLKQVSKSIQELKQNVITLNKDLRLMEEKLLFPSSTKYTIFISVSSGSFFKLESVKLRLDGKLVSSQMYSEKQRQALLRGGVHKFYVTNLNEGDHSATLFFTGVGSGGRDYKRASTIDFKKGPAGEYLEVAVSDDSVTQEPVFSIKQW
jgi:hypothetical protein